MKRGFTIIELLVVVSITGLLSSIILGNLTQARQKAIQTAAIQFETSVRRSIGDTIVGSWDFNEGSGHVATDTSGNGHDGEISSAVYVSPGFNGTGSALYFSGTSYVEGIGTPTGDNLGLTISAWIKPTTNTNTRTIFVSGTASCRTIGMGITSTHISVSNNNQQQFMDDPGPGGGLGDEAFDSSKSPLLAASDMYKVNAQTNPAVIPNNVWTNVVTTFTPEGAVKTYANGKLIGAATGFATTNCGGGNQWSIGAVALGAGTSDFFEGAIDDVIVYESSLTVAEVEALYARNEAKRLAQIQ